MEHKEVGKTIEEAEVEEDERRKRAEERDGRNRRGRGNEENGRGEAMCRVNDYSMCITIRGTL